MKVAQITFTGGVARNEGLCECLRMVLGAEIKVPAECQLAGALGAAPLVRDHLS
ncbi:MAG: FGGY-family carbohydrate kinase [Syntrophomonadaceae bacterium]|nr:FGGY-family carbohydrate kinase [Syntrophomonadaceae bacterium]MDD3023772.1 FGGY-family carbohydrate kinase [Syntrophomonadaceae bacterium]